MNFDQESSQLVIGQRLADILVVSEYIPHRILDLAGGFIEYLKQKYSKRVFVFLKCLLLIQAKDDGFDLPSDQLSHIFLEFSLRDLQDVHPVSVHLPLDTVLSFRSSPSCHWVTYCSFWGKLHNCTRSDIDADSRLFLLEEVSQELEELWVGDPSIVIQIYFIEELSKVLFAYVELNSW